MVVSRVEGVSRWKGPRWHCGRHVEAGCVKACERGLVPGHGKKVFVPLDDG